MTDELKEKEVEEEDRSKVLYSISFPQQQRNVLLKNGIAMVTTTKIDSDDTDDNSSQRLIDSSSSVWYPEPMDTIFNNKLSNMWLQRQLIKGDAGESFTTRDGLLIKCCNLFSSFGFKGLLIELRENGLNGASTVNNDDFGIYVKSITDILETMGISNYKTSNAVLMKQDQFTTPTSRTNKNTELCDLAYQYVNVLD